MEIIGLKKLGETLGYTDMRSVRKWCKVNGVFIIKQGKSEVVSQANFQEAFDKPLISELQKRYGKEWQSIYQSYLDDKVPQQEAIKIVSMSGKAFKPDNDIVSKYLSKYENTKAA